MRQSKVQHFVSLSGGKDSTACYALATGCLGGDGFRAIFCDTGHEHPATYEYVERIHEKIGGPKAEIVKADFSKRIEKKRRTVKEKWEEDGVPTAMVERALQVLRPTGNPFLDLAMLNGRFPSTMTRFCTEELKVMPITLQVIQKRGKPLPSRGVKSAPRAAR
ncbi:phosphoadenosine phosphosulfate reductase family protein, partial [Roseibium sp. RKSG952]|uniref:phosphoadenosine phosphosulfate reductase domain-containing protein n=1 Tax=Roseibium sp. RKSG952 TaxID=2529384 RepID=UPI0012BB8C52